MDAERWQRLSPLLDALLELDDEARAQSHGTQRDYDQAYIQCMYGRGHRVPVSAQFARSLPAAAPVAPAGGVTGPDLPPPPAYPPTSVPPADFRP